jgi:rRNA maturation protein Nop10
VALFRLLPCVEKVGIYQLRERRRRAEAGGEAEAAEVNGIMVIEFLCPQGHKIRCGDDRVGKPAKCPKCGVRFYVPGPDDDSSDSGAWATAPAETSNTPASGSTGALKDQIEFLCPNGHRVWAPLALQGRAGQCPDCGSKFHIPTLADYQEMPLDIVSSDDSVVNLDPLNCLQGNGSALKQESSPLRWQGDRGLTDGIGTERPDEMVEFLADLVADLPEGATIELHTTDGRRFVPEQFARGLCGPGRLVFSTKVDDEARNLVVLPWPSIGRIEICGLKQLPLEFRK